MEKEQDLYKYTREHSQEERDQTAQTLYEKRSEYFGRQKNLTTQAEGLQQESESRETLIGNLAKEITGLEDYLSQLNKDILSRTGHLFEIKRVRKQIDGKKVEYEVGSEELGEITATLAELRQQQLDRHELEEAKQILGNFWQEQSQEWQNFQEEEKVRDVKNVCLRNNCAIVHGIHPTFTPENNSLLETGSTWQDKLKILLALEPVIATSTVHAGDDGNINLWCKMGVILSGGRVQSASADDIGSLAKGIKERDDHGKMIVGLEKGVQEQITKAISERGNGYNEVIVQDPKFAGFFFCVDPSKNPYEGQTSKRADISEITEITAKYGIPLYMMEGGKLYRAIINEQGGVVQGEEVDIQSLMAQQYDIDGNREQLIEDILDGAPIKKERVAEQEAAMINSHFGGREYYVTLLGKTIIRSKDPAKYKPTPYVREPEEGGTQYKEGDKLMPLSEIRRGREKDQYYVYERTTFDPLIQGEKFGGWVVRRSWKRDGVVLVGDIFDTYSDETDDDFIWFGIGSGFRLDHKILSNDDYFTQIEMKIEEEIRNREETKEKWGDLWFNDQTQRINQLCFHIYGFGEQAAQQGDQETKQKSIEITNKYFPYDQYQAIIDSRLDEHGNFRLTKKDLAIPD